MKIIINWEQIRVDSYKILHDYDSITCASLYLPPDMILTNQILEESNKNKSFWIYVYIPENCKLPISNIYTLRNRFIKLKTVYTGCYANRNHITVNFWKYEEFSQEETRDILLEQLLD